MASSLFVNTLQVNFASVLAMEHAGMVRMFKSLEVTGLRGFLEGTTHVFEYAVTEFFSNARVLAGTIVSTVCGQNLVVIEEIFSATFKLPTEGMANFAGIQKETIAEMKHRFFATEVPFKISGKKSELLFEYRLLHDIVAKSLCAKAGSFDSVTCEKFEFMVTISAGISVNWGNILFQRLLGMVQYPKKQSQGYIVPVSMLMEILVKADLGTSIKLHAKKILTSKQVENYIKTNQGIAPEGEATQRTEDTTSNTEGGASQISQPVQPLVATETNVLNPKKRKQQGGGRKKQTKTVAKRKEASESYDSDTTISMPLRDFVKRRRTERQRTEMGWTDAKIVSQPDPTLADAGQPLGNDDPLVGPGEPETMELNQPVQGRGEDNFEEGLNSNARKEHEEQ
ncbi:hypothetical protein F511_15767 [Dorcoceras hygrometricum]|nr:hypothetical protein F511_15767 [Dorcoceras hygrometricum]